MSGFEKMGDKIGYGYEAVCQRALWEGIFYLAKIDNPKDIFKGTHGMKARDKEGNTVNFVGICYTPDSAKELESIWSKLDKEVFKGWTGAQHEVVVGHLKYIAENGYEKWLDEFKKEPERIFEIDLDKLFKAESYHNYKVIENYI